MRIRNEQLRAVLIVGGSRTERLDRARVWVEHALSENPALVVWRGENPERWPFRPIAVGLPSEATPLVWVNDIEHAFPNHQVGGTRLVLTQSTYVLQKWCDLLATRSGSLFLAVGSENGLERNAPEVFAGRGPWGRFTIRRVAPEGDDSTPLPGRGDWGANDPEELLVAAYNQPSPSTRIEACRRSVELRPDWPVARLALASALMEQQELDDAREMLDEAVRLAPDCEAVRFERGKLWLRYDDMERASDSFRRAGELMATFSAAFSNLGATLGELDRPE